MLGPASVVCGLRFCKVCYGISAILEASVRYALDGVLLDGASGASPEVLLEASLIQRM